MRRSALRAVIVGAAVLLCALAGQWAATPFVGNAASAGWISGFIRATDAGLVHWNPKNAKAHIAGGFTDWTPDLVYDGEPLPENVVARYWCEYKYEREVFGALAPLTERATIDLRISDPNFAPAAPALVEKYRPAAARFVLEQVDAAKESSAGAPPFWTRTFDVASVRSRDGVFRRIFWRGAPTQVGLSVLFVVAGAMFMRALWLLWRVQRTEAPAAHPLCPRCLYDVSGQDVTACPECAQALDRGPDPVMGPVVVTVRRTRAPRPTR
jgi:hypothetical protein